MTRLQRPQTQPVGAWDAKVCNSRLVEAISHYYFARFQDIDEKDLFSSRKRDLVPIDAIQSAEKSLVHVHKPRFSQSVCQLKKDYF